MARRTGKAGLPTGKVDDKKKQVQGLKKLLKAAQKDLTAEEGKKERGIYEREPGSGVYWIQYFDADGNRRREKAGTITQARNLLTKRKAEKLFEAKLPELARKKEKEPTIEDLLTKYLPEIRANKKDYAVDERIGKLWVEAFRDRGLSTIQPGDIEAVKAGWLVDGLKPGTVNRRLAMLKTLFGKAVRDDLAPKNPLGQKRVKMLRESPPRERILTHEEEELLMAELSRPDQLALIIALHTGLRVSEQLERTRDDLNLRRRILEIPEAKGGGRQQVHLNSVAVDAFKELLASHDSRWLFPDPSKEGPLSRFTLTPRFAKACKKLTKLAKEKKGGADLTGLSWHSTRHTFISRLVMLGTPLPTVQKLARHKSIQMTLRYSHLYPDQEQQALGNLANAYPRPAVE